MQTAWFEAHEPAAEVLKIGELETPEPGHGEIRGTQLGGFIGWACNTYNLADIVTLQPYWLPADTSSRSSTITWGRSRHTNHSVKLSIRTGGIDLWAH